MRHWMNFALAMMVSFSVVTTADAKKPKKGEETPTEQTDAAPAAAATLEIVATGIADVDNVFNQAADPIQTIRDARTTVDNLSKNLGSALGLAEGAALTDALNDLKAKAEGKITVAMNDKAMPALKASDAVPENVQKAIDGVNQSLDEIAALIPKLTDLPGEFKEIVGAAQAINPASLANSGVKATEVPKIMKAIKGNLGVITAAPNEVSELMNSIEGLKSSIQSTFGA